MIYVSDEYSKLYLLAEVCAKAEWESVAKTSFHTQMCVSIFGSASCYQANAQALNPNFPILKLWLPNGIAGLDVIKKLHGC